MHRSRSAQRWLAFRSQRLRSAISTRSGLHIALDNPRAADSIVDVIGEKSYLLAANPLAGRTRAELAEGLRSFPAGRYLPFYRPLPDGIETVRILDAARDIDTEFQAG